MPKKSDKVERVVKYPHLSISVCGRPETTGVGDETAEKVRKALLKIAPGLVDFRSPMTEEDCKLVVGWEEEQEGGKKFGEDYVLKDRYGKKVRLNNNLINRPFNLSDCDAYVQEHLNRNWRLNGETLSVGRYGNVTDGQKTFVSIVLANQELRRHPDRWGKNWPEGEVTLERIVVYGVSEDDDVVNTINTGKGRTFADVIYRTGFFRGMRKGDQQSASKILDYAVRRLWVRTGVYRDAEAPRRTHAEGIDFVERHKTVLKCVKFVLGEQSKTAKGKGKNDSEVPAATLGDYLPLGYSAAMLYLMSASSTEYADYYDADDRVEKNLSWDNAKTAEAFWAGIVADPKLRHLRDALALVNDSPLGWNDLVSKDKLVCAAWGAFSGGHPVAPEPLGQALESTDQPVLPGIDWGNKRERPRPDPTTEEKTDVESRTDDVRNGKADPGDPLVTLRKKYKSVDVFLTRNPGGSVWYVWEKDAERAAPVLRLEPRMNPSGRLNIVVKPDDLDGCLKTLNEGGLVAATADKQEDGKWWVEVSRPGGKP